jgi:hypothetical protein
MSAYVSIRQHTSAEHHATLVAHLHTSAYVSIRQRSITPPSSPTGFRVSIRTYAPATQQVNSVRILTQQYEY